MEKYGMDKETITIDVDKLRSDMLNDSYGVFFGGGFGGALIEAGDVERASPDELVEMARRWNLDLRDYQV